jgi:cell division septation protein DedD
LVGAAVLLALFIFYSVRRAASSLTAERATREKLSEAPSNGVASSVMAPNTKGASSDDGFILQVAAMRSENSAILLASLLQRRGFPGYVFKPAAAKLYRVLVGPYGDADSAVKVEEKLRQQGFEAIRERNTPAQ